LEGDYQKLEEEGDYKLKLIVNGRKRKVMKNMTRISKTSSWIRWTLLVDEKLTTMYSFLVAELIESKSSNKQEDEDKLLDELIHH